MKPKQKIKSDVSTLQTSILGVFEGECADAEITNENGLDINRPVWEELFASEEYQKALKLGHYIGFLGHPEDPGCQDFKQACIVMTDCYIADDGKLYGTFNLIDTPVGRVVKAFIDAGVTFGISVRGAGDIVDNSVVPGSFVFRGFDLVTFPAYPEAIPTFSEIAASTDAATKAKYIAAANTLGRELDKITSHSALSQLKASLSDRSSEYKIISRREKELDAESEVINGPVDQICDETAILSAKLEAMTDLFMAKSEECDMLKTQLDSAVSSYKQLTLNSSRELASVQRIMGDQVKQLTDACNDSESKFKKEVEASKKLRSELATEKQRSQNYRDRFMRNKADIRATREINEELRQKVAQLEADNLKYRQKVQASRQELDDKQTTINGLRADLDETVAQVKASKASTSNRDGKVSQLLRSLDAAETLIAQYQDAYASLYASAVGADLNHISVTASTSVDQLRQAITGDTSAVQPSDVFVEPQPVEVDDDEYGTIVGNDGGDLITC